MEEIENESLQQRRLRLRPERIGGLASGRGGVLNERFDKAEHVLVVAHIGHGVVAEGSVGVEQIENPHRKAVRFQRASRFAQNFGFGITDHHGTLAAEKNVRNGIGAAFSRSAASDDKHVGIAFMLVAVHSNLEMTGENHVLPGMLSVPVSSRDLKHISPFCGTVLLSPSPVFPAGFRRRSCHRVSHGKKNQAAEGSIRPADGKRLVHGCGQLFKKDRERIAGTPASRCEQRRPPDDG